MTHATETPITDALFENGWTVPKLWDHSRDLERRLAAAEAETAEAREWQKSLVAERDAAESALRSAGERVREECAKLCGEIAAHHFDRYRNGTIGTGRGSQHAEGMADGAEACETAIRRALPAQAAVGAWRSHDNTGMRYPEECDLIGGATDQSNAAPQEQASQVDREVGVLTADDPAGAAPTPAEPHAVGAEPSAGRISDCAIFQAFWQRHALGSKITPSCFKCGQQKPFSTTHLELPDIGLCANCAAPTEPPPAGAKIEGRE